MNIRLKVLLLLVCLGFCFGGISSRTLVFKKELHSRGAEQLCKSSAGGEQSSDIQAAFGLFYLGKDSETANKRLQKALLDIGGFDSWDSFQAADVQKYHSRMPVLLRFYYLFSASGTDTLADVSESMLADVFSAFTAAAEREFSVISSDVWLIKENEFTDISDICSMYLSMQALDSPETDNDKLDTWNDYLLEYCYQRTKKGLWTHTISGKPAAGVFAAFLNLYDFAEEPLLKKRASFLLNIALAEFAQDQFSFIRGGARTNTDISTNDGDSFKMMLMPFLQTDMSWSGSGQYTDSGSGNIYIAATTGWRMSDVVMDMFLDAGGKGEYEYISKPPAVIETGESGLKRVLPDERKLLRYSFCTSKYIMGAFFLDPSEGFSSGGEANGFNRQALVGASQGLMFESGAYVMVTGGSEGASMPVQAIGLRNIMIFQQPQDGAGDSGLNIHLSEGLLDSMTERGGWQIFTEDGIRTAIKGLSSRRLGASCGYRRQSDTELILQEPAAPFVIITAPRTTCKDFDEFVVYITEHNWRIRDRRLSYTAATDQGEGVSFEMALDGTSPPKRNGKEIKFTGLMLFDSPLISSAVDSGIFALKKDSRKVMYYLEQDKKLISGR